MKRLTIILVVLLVSLQANITKAQQEKSNNPVVTKGKGRVTDFNF